MFIRRVLVASGTSLLLFGSALRADTIQLVNGDRLKGKVTSLNEKELVLTSDSFGELRIPRDKVDLVSLGDKGLPDFTQAPVSQKPATNAGVETDAAEEATSNLGQYLQDPSIQSQVGPMVEQLLGPKADRDTQKKVEEAQRGMRELRKDLGKSPEGDALESYLRFFDQIAPLARGLQDVQPPPAAKRRAPRDRKAPSKGAAPEPADEGAATQGDTSNAAKPETQPEPAQPQKE